MTPVIIAFFDGDPEVRNLSNFAHTPFVLDERRYETVEGFWQGLKTEDYELRDILAQIPDGLELKKLGRHLSEQNPHQIFSYEGSMYRVGTEAHHMLLERAIRAKVSQNTDVAEKLRWTHPRPLRHMLRTRFGSWRPGDSLRLPAKAFENMLTKIREELIQETFEENYPLPHGIEV